MRSKHPKEEIRTMLEHDRIWSAYALADLDPKHDRFAHWYVQDEAVLLRYDGLQPPILFAIGPGDKILPLCRNLPPQTYQISLPIEVLETLAGKFEITEQIPMLRLNRVNHETTLIPDFELRRLTNQDITTIGQLYRGHADAPDGYHPRQVEPGPFIGAWESGALVATAGVHVLSKIYGVAALGNVFTHPEFRKRGFAQACSQSVLLELEKSGIATIVLNVAEGNEAAIRLYQRLGFSTHCSFYEGAIIITDVP